MGRKEFIEGYKAGVEYMIGDTNFTNPYWGLTKRSNKKRESWNKGYNEAKEEYRHGFKRINFGFLKKGLLLSNMDNKQKGIYIGFMLVSLSIWLWTMTTVDNKMRSLEIITNNDVRVYYYTIIIATFCIALANLGYILIVKCMPSSEGDEGQASGFPLAEEPKDEGS